MKISLYNFLLVLGTEPLFKEQKVSLKTAYTLSKIYTRAREEYKFYTEKFKEILEKYAERDKDGNMKFSADGENVLIDKNFSDVCSKELEELQNLEIEVPDYELPLEDFNSIKITIEEIQPLLYFIKNN